MRIEVDMWITPDGYTGGNVEVTGKAHHLKGTVEIPEETETDLVPVQRVRQAVSMLRESMKTLLAELDSFGPTRVGVTAAHNREMIVADHLDRLVNDLES